MIDSVICTQNVEISSQKYMNLIHNIINWLLYVHGDTDDFAIEKAAMIITMYLCNGNSNIKIDKMLYTHWQLFMNTQITIQITLQVSIYSQPITNLSDKLIKPNIVSKVNYNLRFNNHIV